MGAVIEFVGHFVRIALPYLMIGFVAGFVSILWLMEAAGASLCF